MLLSDQDSFQHILRVLNTNVDGKQKIMYALTSIKGLGRRFSNVACKKAEIDLNKRCVGALPEAVLVQHGWEGCMQQSPIDGGAASQPGGQPSHSAVVAGSCIQWRCWLSCVGSGRRQLKTRVARRRPRPPACSRRPLASHPSWRGPTQPLETCSGEQSAVSVNRPQLRSSSALQRPAPPAPPLRHGRAGELSAEELERILVIVSNPRSFKIPDWFLNRQKDVKDGRYSQARHLRRL